jgi:hypothetical protein
MPLDVYNTIARNLQKWACKLLIYIAFVTLICDMSAIWPAFNFKLFADLDSVSQLCKTTNMWSLVFQRGFKALSLLGIVSRNSDSAA